MGYVSKYVAVTVNLTNRSEHFVLAIDQHEIKTAENFETLMVSGVDADGVSVVTMYAVGTWTSVEARVITDE